MADQEETNLATTTANLFRRKSLDTILSAFTKAGAELDAFIKQNADDIAGINKQVGKLTADRSRAEAEIARASRAKSKLADIVG